jgi:nucleoside-diphosphate-sugar epimerase
MGKDKREIKMNTRKILVIGACGQIGVELTLALRQLHGAENVVATDLKSEHPLLKGTGPYISINVLKKEMLRDTVRYFGIGQVYLLAAMLSATGEKEPALAWKLNMESLLNVLEIAREEKIKNVFWPSSIAVFGPSAPKENCPQATIIEPSTVYGISKYAGELWCQYYHEKFGVDVRSLRYPGLISYKSAPGGGTTDYAIEIFHEAIKKGQYNCFLQADTVLPMMYMPDAVRATIELMEAPASSIKVRTSYNIAGVSFSPLQIASQIQKILPGFEMNYNPDYRQSIADSWPYSIDDSPARNGWGWEPKFDLRRIAEDMLHHLHAGYLV